MTTDLNVTQSGGEVSTLKDQGILAAALHELRRLLSYAFIDCHRKSAGSRYSLHVRFASVRNWLGRRAQSPDRGQHLRA